MTLEERIEVAARAIAANDGYGDFDKLFQNIQNMFRAHASVAVRAAFPEFTEPPSHWLAPWEATKAMCQSVAADNYNFIADDNADAVYADMRDSYLSHKEQK